MGYEHPEGWDADSVRYALYYAPQRRFVLALAFAAIGLLFVGTSASAQDNSTGNDGGVPNAQPTAPALNEPSVPPPLISRPSAPMPAPLPPSVPAPISAGPSPFTGRLYGFIDSRFNANTPEPNGDVNADGTPSRDAAIYGDLALPSFHIMAQGSLYSRYRYYFNLAAFDVDDPTHDDPLGVRNAWLEMSILGDYLNLRVGKLYRRFGLYNEILDTTPSFLGIELPVVFGMTRPMLTRTTNLMLHGKAAFGSSTISYAATLGRDEYDPDDDIISPGFDLNYDWDSTILVGTSYYTTGGRVSPHSAPGTGSPSGGVAPWMRDDAYQVYGGYGRLTLGQFLLHAEAWVSPHKGVRDPDRVLVVAENAEHFSPANRARMGVSNVAPTVDMVNTDASYVYSTVNVRAAYTFEVGGGADPVELTPFVNFEYIHNLESIHDEAYGGDGEAGGSPRGIAMHYRLGMVLRPVPTVAFKVEGTHAMYGYGSSFESDEELWMSLSYQWELVHQ